MGTVFEDPIERGYWSAIWDRLVSDGRPDTWDYQWTFTCLVNGGLTALPNTNLVSNVGFGADGSHTTAEMEPTVYGEAQLLPLLHPTFLLGDAEADRFTFDHVFGGKAGRQSQQLHSRFKALASRAFGKAMRISKAPMA
jgi:hypothetical protein